MLDCRYYDLCCFTDDSCNGEPECPKRGTCQFYVPMPDRDALLTVADELSKPMRDGGYSAGIAKSIREALGGV